MIEAFLILHWLTTAGPVPSSMTVAELAEVSGFGVATVEAGLGLLKWHQRIEVVPIDGVPMLRACDD